MIKNSTNDVKNINRGTVDITAVMSNNNKIFPNLSALNYSASAGSSLTVTVPDGYTKCNYSIQTGSCSFEGMGGGEGSHYYSGGIMISDTNGNFITIPSAPNTVSVQPGYTVRMSSNCASCGSFTSPIAVCGLASIVLTP